MPKIWAAQRPWTIKIQITSRQPSKHKPEKGLLEQDLSRMMKILIPHILFTLCISCLITSSSHPALADPLECPKCHKTMIDRTLQRIYIHDPFANNQCATCHQAGNSGLISPAAPVMIGQERTANSSIKGKGNGATSYSKRPLMLVSSHLNLAKTHWFVIPSKKIGSNLIISARAGDNEKRLRFMLPDPSQLEHRQDDGTPPEISQVKVLKIQKGLLLSATLCWKTDEPSDSEVTYFLDDSTRSHEGNCVLAKDHILTLYGLSANKTYKFSVSSKDVFGNKSTSAVYSFSTSGRLATYEDPSTSLNVDLSGLKIKRKLFVVKDDYVLVLQANRPVTISIFCEKGQQITGKKPAYKLPENHIGLRNLKDMGYDLCIACHRNSACKHPMNIRPRPGMTIPREYPTSASGEVICISCHTPHASNQEFLLIKCGKGELCVGCHQKKQAALARCRRR